MQQFHKLLFFAVEHALWELHGFTLAIDCNPEMPIYEGFIKHSFPWMLAYMPYNIGVGILFHVSFNQSINLVLIYGVPKVLIPCFIFIYFHYLQRLQPTIFRDVEVL